jgi:hypothetical protein
MHEVIDLFNELPRDMQDEIRSRIERLPKHEYVVYDKREFDRAFETRREAREACERVDVEWGMGLWYDERKQRVRLLLTRMIEEWSDKDNDTDKDKDKDRDRDLDLSVEFASKPDDSVHTRKVLLWLDNHKRGAHSGRLPWIFVSVSSSVKCDIPSQDPNNCPVQFCDLVSRHKSSNFVCDALDLVREGTHDLFGPGFTWSDTASLMTHDNASEKIVLDFHTLPRQLYVCVDMVIPVTRFDEGMKDALVDLIATYVPFVLGRSVSNERSEARCDTCRSCFVDVDGRLRSDVMARSPPRGASGSSQGEGTGPDEAGTQAGIHLESLVAHHTRSGTLTVVTTEIPHVGPSERNQQHPTDKQG